MSIWAANFDIKYRVISHRTGKNLGTFDTKAEAKRHRKHLKRFKK